MTLAGARYRWHQCLVYDIRFSGHFILHQLQGGCDCSTSHKLHARQGMGSLHLLAYQAAC